jgi:predicted nuclease of restriction endonuclease-like (RecB) superfamily
LDARQKIEGWGAAVIPRLARDIRNDLPEIKGFSERNIKRMLAFYREYAGATFVPQPVAQMDTQQKVPQAVALFSSDVLLALPWGHHLLLMEKFKEAETRHWYMQATLTNGWSRNVLHMQIETSAHVRQGKATSNFALRLPLPQSDLVQQALKDPYLFDFLTLAEPFRERELETGLIAHLEKFLLELGQGFAFVGRQYHVAVGDPWTSPSSLSTQRATHENHPPPQPAQPVHPHGRCRRSGCRLRWPGHGATQRDDFRWLRSRLPASAARV